MNMLKVELLYLVNAGLGSYNTLPTIYFLLFSLFIIQTCRSYADGVAGADLVLFVTTRPTTGNTLAWAVACERDQWGRAIAGFLSFSFF